MILFEGSRDNLLQPYRDLLAQQGQDLSLAQFKQLMHQKLTVEAGIDALSRGSNFYLAGAVRYYFDGALTENKELGVFTGTRDVFRHDVCSMLNDIIIFLRESYIDSVGTKWEVPEDFGTLSIDKLFKKYARKIAKRNETNGLNAASISNVGGAGNYSFEVIVSQNELRKYQLRTNPGSWCITYSDPKYYNYYTKENNSFFVIFARQGYENIPYKMGEGFPKDEYGTSLIAVQLSKTDGHLVGATTRWNHGGYNGVPTVPNADYVWRDMAEMCNETGIDPALFDEAFRIYTEKKKDEKAIKSAERKRENEIKAQKIRHFKYLQILINQGQSLENLKSNGLIANYKILAGSGKMSKTLSIIYVNYEGQNIATLCNRGRLAFDSIVMDDAYERVNALWNWDDDDKNHYPSMLQIIIGGRTYYFDVALNDVVRLNGKKMTSSNPNGYGVIIEGDERERFCFLEQGRKGFVLYDVAKHQIIQSPRGDATITYIALGPVNHTIRSFVWKEVDPTKIYTIIFGWSNETIGFDFQKGQVIDLRQFDAEGLSVERIEGQLTDGTVLVRGYDEKEYDYSYYFVKNGSIIPFNGIKYFSLFKYYHFPEKQGFIDNAIALQYVPKGLHKCILFDNGIKKVITDKGWDCHYEGGLFTIRELNRDVYCIYDVIHHSFANVNGTEWFGSVGIDDQRKATVRTGRQKYTIIFDKPGGTAIPMGVNEGKIIREFFQGTPDSITDNVSGKQLIHSESDTIDFGFFPTNVGEKPKFVAIKNAGHRQICEAIAEKILSKYRYEDDHIMTMYVADAIYQASAGIGRVWTKEKFITLWFAPTPEDLVTILNYLGGVKKFLNYKLINNVGVNITVGQYLRKGNYTLESEAKVQSSWFKPFKVALETPFECDYLDKSMLKIPDDYSGVLAQKSKKLGKMTIAQYNSLIHPFESLSFGNLKKLVEEKIHYF